MTRTTPLILAQLNNVQPPWSAFVVVLIVGIVLLALIASLVFARYFNVWVQARMTGADVGIVELVGMSFRKVNPNVVVRSRIMALQAGLSDEDGVTTQNLEAHYLAGGNVPDVVRVLIAANRAGTRLSFERAAAIDLSGRDVLEAVQVAGPTSDGHNRTDVT